ncbi:MAG: hypothetical protein H0T48_05895 [Gemmatimonadaceae bacterium]|nr:hypothetical protein [Gemmatimonadaceae bacterium]
MWRRVLRPFVAVIPVMLALCLIFAKEVGAQTTSVANQGLSPEVRVDAIFARETALHAGIGLATPLGTYVRAGVVGAAGVSNGSPSGRVDAVVRFLLDPFRETKWGPYGGGGLSTRFGDGRAARALMLIFFGAEGPLNRGFSPAIEVGLGGGARLAIVLRRGVAERR